MNFKTSTWWSSRVLEVGVGFNFQIGDVVQSVYDYVDIAWKTALAGGTVILLTAACPGRWTYRLPWCLALMSLFAVAVLVGWTLPRRSGRNCFIKDLSFFLAVCTVVFYLVFPFSICGPLLFPKK
ncbi:MAG: hypothetical protein U5R30_02685 [Deltaproteobacteria bacterium]|nr:hypothetical protein [Deltaproteobacteria bacterium]